MENKEKRIYKIAPYSAYEFEKIESYLENMAKKGYILESVFCGVFCFREDKPKKVRYRLEAVSKKREEKDDIEFYESCGWIKIDTWKEFRIWFTADESAREIDTEREVKAISLKSLKKQLVSKWIMLVFWLFIYPVVRFYGRTTVMFIELGSIVSFVGLVLIICLLVYSEMSIVYLSRRIKALKNDEPIEESKGKTRRAFAAILLISFIVWGFFFLNNAMKYLSGEYEMPLSEYEGELPFADLSSFIDGGVFKPNGDLLNTVSIRSDILAPKIIDLSQSGRVTSNIADSFSGGLNVQYYELASESLAKTVFRDLYIHDKFSKRFKYIKAPEISSDDAAYYFDIFNTLLIRQGNKVARLTFYQTSGEKDFDVSLLGEIFANSMKR